MRQGLVSHISCKPRTAAFGYKGPKSGLKLVLSSHLLQPKHLSCRQDQECSLKIQDVLIGPTQNTKILSELPHSSISQFIPIDRIDRVTEFVNSRA